jgi:hypothetical protein
MTMTPEEFRENLVLSTVPIRRYEATLLPGGIASACMVDYHGKRILLSVQHATGDMGDWGIQCRYEPGKGTAVWRIGSMCFIKRMSTSSGEARNVDLSYVEIPDNLKITDQTINPLTGTIEKETDRRIGKVDFSLTPSREVEYGFSGQVLPTVSGSHLTTELRVYTGLVYDGDHDDYYRFKLPMAHPGHEQFKGCSGAPIMDAEGHIVALVCFGDIDANVIFGVSLKKYEMMLSASYGPLSQCT